MKKFWLFVTYWHQQPNLLVHLTLSSDSPARSDCRRDWEKVTKPLFLMNNTCPMVHSGISKPDSIGIFDPFDRWRSLNMQNNWCLCKTQTQDKKKMYVLMHDWFTVSLVHVLDIWLHVVHYPGSLVGSKHIFIKKKLKPYYYFRSSSWTNIVTRELCIIDNMYINFLIKKSVTSCCFFFENTFNLRL